MMSKRSSSTRRKMDESGCTGREVASVDTSWWMRWALALPPVLSCCFDAWVGLNERNGRVWLRWSKAVGFQIRKQQRVCGVVWCGAVPLLYYTCEPLISSSVCSVRKAEDVRKHNHTHQQNHPFLLTSPQRAPPPIAPAPHPQTHTETQTQRHTTPYINVHSPTSTAPGTRSGATFRAPTGARA